MTGQLVPTKRTRITAVDFSEGLLDAWPLVEDATLTGACAALLWAQVMLETGGGEHCYGFNVGNAKWFPGNPQDFQCLKGVWEGVTPKVAAELIRTGQAKLDPSPDHHHAVDPQRTGARIAVVFEPPHPETRFRAYPDMGAGILAHLRLLRGAYLSAWRFALQGMIPEFATALWRGGKGYFTSDPGVYARGMQRHAKTFVLGPLPVTEAEDAEPTRPDAPASRREEVTGSGGIIHPWHFSDPEPDEPS